MKKILLIVIMICGISLFAADPDESYIKTFGYGSIIVSGMGYPGIDYYNSARVDYKDGVFHVKGGKTGTIDMRQILPQETTIGSIQEKLLLDTPVNAKHITHNVQVWVMWSSSDRDADPTITDKTVWPAHNEIPPWKSLGEFIFVTRDEYKNDTTSGFSWDAIPEGESKKALQKIFVSASAGTKLYVIFHLGYEYKVPKGETESLWNGSAMKWEDHPSDGEIGYVLSGVLSSATIVVDQIKE